MQTYEPMVGNTINHSAEEMVRLADKTNEMVTASFNDIQLTANPGDNAENIVKFYSEESTRRAETYRNSPEGKQAVVEAEERKQVAQSKLDKAMTELSVLNFSDLTAVINWLEKVRDPSDYVGVVTPHEQIVATFRKHGFEPGANCGENFNGEDKENFAGWLIGQALDGLAGSVHAIHQVFHKFADDWRGKFAQA